MKTLFYFFFFLILFACNRNANDSENPIVEIPKFSSQKKTKTSKSQYSFETINGEKGWGYQIYKEGNLQINQMHIPAVQGLRGFDSKEKAAIVASYIIKQIEKGIFPPTITKNTLDSLKVL